MGHSHRSRRRSSFLTLLTSSESSSHLLPCSLSRCHWTRSSRLSRGCVLLWVAIRSQTTGPSCANARYRWKVRLFSFLGLPSLLHQAYPRGLLPASPHLNAPRMTPVWDQGPQARPAASHRQGSDNVSARSRLRSATLRGRLIIPAADLLHRAQALTAHRRVPAHSRRLGSRPISLCPSRRLRRALR